jgi:hypothetical protein
MSWMSNRLPVAKRSRDVGFNAKLEIGVRSQEACGITRTFGKDGERQSMKMQLLSIAVGILTVAGIRAEPTAKITFETSHRKVFSATEPLSRMVYIELPVTVTNTSTEAIRFGTNLGPEFNVYVQRRMTSKHWSDITPRGMCGVGRGATPLSPALRSGPTAGSVATRQKQIPSSQSFQKEITFSTPSFLT